MDEMREALAEFLAESHENLDRLDRDLVAIEADPRDRGTLDAIFRTVHNLKGTGGFFGLPRLGAIAHAGESLLVRFRDESIVWRPEITSALLALGDAVRRDLHAIQATGSEDEHDHSSLIETLERLQVARSPRPSTENRAEPGAVRLAEPSLPAQSRPEAPSRPLEPPVRPAEPPSRPPRNQIRVDVDLLDRLMDLVGELVLTRNQLLRHSGSRKDAELAGVSQRLDHVTSSLQEGVMQARMRPIGVTWDPLPRVVRDLALACGKLIQLEFEGRSTELDRTIIEAIKDPLTHLVRNAVDHGIESPADRRVLGKPEAGRLTLKAAHRAGLVHLEIIDDGAGIDPERVARKALDRGLISREQAARLTEDEAVQLIFLPGFSTAEAVTQVSGRGVGLDVVRANIEAIGGMIEVRSRPGQGTTIVIKVPLTLAIIPCLLVVDGLGDRYAIPQPALVELIRLEGDDVAPGVESIGNAAFHRLRGEFLPLVDLDEVLGNLRLDPRGRPRLDVVVLQADGRKFGLVVEAIRDTEEIVVKPLGRLLQGLPLFAGATILGDGRVALILDTPGLARSAGVATAPTDARLEAGPARTTDARRSYLLLSLVDGRRLAVPLGEVARLREVPASSIDRASGLEVIRHRGRLLPLIRLGGELPPNPTEPLRVVVCEDQEGRSIGLVVHSILDIVEAEPHVDRLAEIPGVVGSAVFRDLVADLVDVPGLIGSHAPGSP